MNKTIKFLRNYALVLKTGRNTEPFIFKQQYPFPALLFYLTDKTSKLVQWKSRLLLDMWIKRQNGKKIYIMLRKKWNSVSRQNHINPVFMFIVLTARHSLANWQSLWLIVENSFQLTSPTSFLYSDWSLQKRAIKNASKLHCQEIINVVKQQCAQHSTQWNIVPPSQICTSMYR